MDYYELLGVSRTASADELPDNIADVRKLLAQLLADMRRSLL